MRMTVPALVAILAVAAGCADTTSPAALRATQAPNAAALRGTPPPPPLDTGAEVSTTSGSFTINTTYFLNPPGNNGFVHFSNNQPANVTVSPDAQIRYHQGSVSGQGTIQAAVPGGVITIDLANSADGGTFNSSCEKLCASIPVHGTFTSNDGGESTPTDGVITIGPPADQPPTRGD